MPELPEVETTRRDLVGRLTGRRVMGVRYGEGAPLPVRDFAPELFRDLLVGRRIDALTRRGKYLVVHLDDGQRLVLHRRMTGNLVLRDPTDPPEPFTRGALLLDDGAELRWIDQRRFGTWRLVLPPDDAVPGIGPEPLDDAWQVQDLTDALANRSAPIKAVLLDQRRVAGLGNIYADESLHMAGIHPQRPARSLSGAECERLHAAVRAVLLRAIELQGSSAQHHVGGLGQKGSMQDEWRVYRRTGQPCSTCGAAIIKSRVAGRGTHLCPYCQPAPTGYIREPACAGMDHRRRQISDDVND